MTTFELLHDKILRLRINNQQPKYVYVGEFEYRELENLADRASSFRENDKRCEFMGIEVIRVNKNNHINVTA
jgi:hypothetical protein